jgi:ribulose 1,5-bisphosphate synthetase/thiazole synthase
VYASVFLANLNIPPSRASIQTIFKSMDAELFKVIIVRGGLVGLYIAHALQRERIEFMLLEKQKMINNPSG